MILRRRKVLVIVGITLAVAGSMVANGRESGFQGGEPENILGNSDVPWETLDNGWRRQVLFSGQLTLVVLEAQGPETGPISLHHHPHDQVSYLIEGEIEVQVGEDTQQIGKGGFFRIPSNMPHGIRVLSPTATLVDVFTPPREDFRPEE